MREEPHFAWECAVSMLDNRRSVFRADPTEIPTGDQD
jgi:hypothetical protein